MVFVYDLSTKTVKTKAWSHLPACTSALRWLEHYYCFHGNNFTRFNPITGEVNGTYPKDARHYFMSCPNFGESPSHRSATLVSGLSETRNQSFSFCTRLAGHGGDYQPPKCSDIKLDAITVDDAGKMYAFAGNGGGGSDLQ